MFDGEYKQAKVKIYVYVIYVNFLLFAHALF
jgi:hypothetical protein